MLPGSSLEVYDNLREDLESISFMLISSGVQYLSVNNLSFLPPFVPWPLFLALIICSSRKCPPGVSWQLIEVGRYAKAVLELQPQANQ